MYNQTYSKLEEDDDLELRIIPLEGYTVIQFSTSMARGTVVVESSVEQEDMADLWKTIFNSMEEYMLLGSGSDTPQ